MVAPSDQDVFTKLAAVDASNRAPGPRLWVYLAVLAGAGVVVLSWMVPEPPAPKRTPAQPYQQVSYTRCAARQPAPGYGSRSTNAALANACPD